MTPAPPQSRLGISAAFLLAAMVGCADGDSGSDSELQAASASSSAPQVPDTFRLRDLRRRMVRRQLAARDIRDTAVLRVMSQVPRHHFVPHASPAAAYADGALPIGHGQTISQPYIVAFMVQAADLDPDDRVLEIGTGSGYGAAVLAGLAAEVYTVEIIPELARRSREVLERLGYENVHVRTGNGWLGWPEHAPFDAVVVTAAPDEIPGALVDQLVEDGILVVPVGDFSQELRVLRKGSRGLVEEASLPVRFVPMVEKPPDSAGG